MVHPGNIDENLRCKLFSRGVCKALTGVSLPAQQNLLKNNSVLRPPPPPVPIVDFVTISGQIRPQLFALGGSHLFWSNINPVFGGQTFYPVCSVLALLCLLDLHRRKRSLFPFSETFCGILYCHSETPLEEKPSSFKGTWSSFPDIFSED